MSGDTRSKSNKGRPYNPGLRELIATKSKWSSAPSLENAKDGFKGWHERGFVPHRDEPGLTQFVTFRVADSFPSTLRSEWAALLEIDDDRKRRKQLEDYLDRGQGECRLTSPAIGQLVEAALRFHHNIKYELLAWVIMPNHLHVLFKTETHSMTDIISNWKEFTARQANRLLGRGGQFWAKDFWDTYMRDSAHESKTVQYIENNPVKALLVGEPRKWLLSSARFRDRYGRLCL